jgi:hypothetical protein
MQYSSALRPTNLSGSVMCPQKKNGLGIVAILCRTRSWCLSREQLSYRGHVRILENATIRGYKWATVYPCRRHNNLVGRVTVKLAGQLR